MSIENLAQYFGAIEDPRCDGTISAARSCPREPDDRGAGPQRCCGLLRSPSGAPKPRWGPSIDAFRRASARPRRSQRRRAKLPSCSTIPCVTAWNTATEGPLNTRSVTAAGFSPTSSGGPSHSDTSCRSPPHQHECFLGMLDPAQTRLLRFRCPLRRLLRPMQCNPGPSPAAPPMWSPSCRCRADPAEAAHTRQGWQHAVQHVPSQTMSVSGTGRDCGPQCRLAARTPACRSRLGSR